MPDASHRRWWLAAAALLASAAVVAAAVFTVQATQTITTASRLQAVLGALESRFAVSHTWLEELAGGDRHVHVRGDILARQAAAARLCRVLRDGGRTRRGPVARLDDAQFGDRSSRLCRGIAAFRRTTARRLAELSRERPDGSGEHRDDVLFTSIMSEADGVRARLGEVADGRRARRAQVLGGALGLLVCLGLVGALLVRRARRTASSRDDDRAAELEELRTIKRALVPAAIPARPGLEIATCHVPAKEGVAGDFHLVVPGPGGSTAIFVGDVAGKGIVAARRAAFLRASLGTFAQYERSPRRLLELGNRALLEGAGVSESFVTLLCVVVDPRAGTLTWAAAGHPPPIDLRTGTPLEQHPSLPLGISADLRLVERAMPLPAGDGLLLHTDGLTEARPPAPGTPELLGPQRVGRLLQNHAGERPRGLAQALRSLAEAHSGGHLADDLCFVVIRATGVAAPVT